MKKTNKPTSTEASLDDLLPPIPSSSTLEPSEPLDEILESLPDLPEVLLADTSSPQAPSSAPATPASTPSTAPRQQASPTLSMLSAPAPRTVCNGCQAGVWMLSEKGDLKVYCRLMYRHIEETLIACDGRQIAAQAMQ